MPRSAPLRPSLRPSLRLSLRPSLSLRSRSAAVSLALLALTAVVAGQCPNQGRSPMPTIIAAETSPVIDQCASTQTTSIATAQTVVQTSYLCPTWETTGLTYFAVIAKPGCQVTVQEVHNLRYDKRCQRPNFLFFPYGEPRCTIYKTTRVLTDDHARRERACENLATAPGSQP